MADAMAATDSLGLPIMLLSHRSLHCCRVQRLPIVCSRLRFWLFVRG